MPVRPAFENANSSQVLQSPQVRTKARQHATVGGERVVVLTTGGLAREFQMRELKRRIRNPSVTIALALIICPAVVAIASIAKAQPEAGRPSNPTFSALELTTIR
jgi:hypothetical protein